MNKEKSGYLAEQWEGNRWTLKLLWGYLFFLPPSHLSFLPSFFFFVKYTGLNSRLQLVDTQIISISWLL
jgi:hypothetical protein